MTESAGQQTVDTGRIMALLTAALIPLLVLLIAALFACILAYIAVQVWGDAVSFRTVLKKTTQVLLVLSIFPAMRFLKLTKFDLGFTEYNLFLRQIAQGFGLGFITLIPVFITLYLLGVDVIDHSKPWTFPWLSKKLVVELALALLISCFEEPVFRGILFAGLSRKMSAWVAICISAFYYAALHFVNSPTETPSAEVTFFTGFQLLREAFAHLLNPQIFSAFMALCAVGIFLGLLRARVKSNLGLCIGCHACWVWQIKLSKSFFNVDLKSPYLYMVSSYDGVIGPLVTLWLALTMIGYYGYQRYGRAS